MAERAYTVTNIPGYGEAAWIVSWSGLLNGDTGAPYEMPSAADRSVEFSGTFGAGGSISLKGSNLTAGGTGSHTLTDPQANAITKTSAALEQVQEITRYMWPHVTAGDGTTNLVATMLVTRKRSL